MTANMRRAARPFVDNAMKANLCGSHWTFSGGNPHGKENNTRAQNFVLKNKAQAGYVTSNMLQYQWVQPYRGTN